MPGCLIVGMNCNFVIVVAEKPKAPSRGMVEIEGNAEWKDWLAFSKRATQAVALFQEIQHPLENLWLFDLENGVFPLHRFLQEFQGNRVPYRVILTEGRPLVFDENGKPGSVHDKV
jgi:hypothetical protein